MREGDIEMGDFATLGQGDFGTERRGERAIKELEGNFKF
jgi:hypothetical protein